MSFNPVASYMYVDATANFYKKKKKKLYMQQIKLILSQTSGSGDMDNFIKFKNNVKHKNLPPL